jgi:hypothetical protein
VKCDRHKVAGLGRPTVKRYPVSSSPVCPLTLPIQRSRE